MGLGSLIAICALVVVIPLVSVVLLSLVTQTILTIAMWLFRSAAVSSLYAHDRSGDLSQMREEVVVP